MKIGLVSSAPLIGVIADSLKKWKARNIVADPVRVATSGSRLLEPEAQDALVTKLLPLADVITPNIPEAEVLAGRKITGEKEMEEAARQLGERYRGVLVKGGHQVSDANDLLYYEGKLTWLRGKRIENPNTHGTGCTSPRPLQQPGKGLFHGGEPSAGQRPTSQARLARGLTWDRERPHEPRVRRSRRPTLRNKVNKKYQKDADF